MIAGNLAGYTGSFGGISLPKPNTQNKGYIAAGKKAAAAGKVDEAKKQAELIYKNGEARFNQKAYTSAIVLFRAANSVSPNNEYLGREGEAWYRLALEKQKKYHGMDAYESGKSAIKAFDDARLKAGYAFSKTGKESLKNRLLHWAKRKSETEAWLNNVDKTAKPPKKHKPSGLPGKVTETEGDLAVSSGLDEKTKQYLIVGGSALVIGIVTYLILRSRR